LLGVFFFLTDSIASALPILRQLGAQGGTSMLKGGDFSMLKVWAGLEARSFLQASIEDVRELLLHSS
jgi:aarF domain-containing kinase